MNPGLDDVTRSLVMLAAAIAVGDTSMIGGRVRDAIAAGVSAVAIDELVLQSVLTVGWPRALVAAGIWRAAAGEPAETVSDDLDYADHRSWTRRGEAACRTIYGDHYARLRDNVRALHPALDAWMVTEGYGRTLARPGLALATRELCTVAQMVVLRTPRQLHSHLLGALRTGASIEQVEATLAETRPVVTRAEWRDVTGLWQRVRAHWTGSE